MVGLPVSGIEDVDQFDALGIDPTDPPLTRRPVIQPQILDDIILWLGTLRSPTNEVPEDFYRNRSGHRATWDPLVVDALNFSPSVARGSVFLPRGTTTLPRLNTSEIAALFTRFNAAGDLSFLDNIVRPPTHRQQDKPAVADGFKKTAQREPVPLEDGAVPALPGKEATGRQREPITCPEDDFQANVNEMNKAAMEGTAMEGVAKEGTAVDGHKPEASSSHDDEMHSGSESEDDIIVAMKASFAKKVQSTSSATGLPVPASGKKTTGPDRTSDSTNSAAPPPPATAHVHDVAPPTIHGMEKKDSDMNHKSSKAASDQSFAHRPQPKFKSAPKTIQGHVKNNAQDQVHDEVSRLSDDIKATQKTVGRFGGPLGIDLALLKRPDNRPLHASSGGPPRGGRVRRPEGTESSSADATLGNAGGGDWQLCRSSWSQQHRLHRPKCAQEDDLWQVQAQPTASCLVSQGLPIDGLGRDRTVEEKGASRRSVEGESFEGQEAGEMMMMERNDGQPINTESAADERRQAKDNTGGGGGRPAANREE
ncbi:hypothetical protein M409DRAFT_59441 [Zasmidium cellare ATCC 36951]|uniref:Uncharacterized protein n=1 Tax=Zasmidium cellare ATCC 36951 TaxID=1080233 RepID=A0A6A6C4S6_ZASCE|nr:uncharacterized protein M409DRAFT_59441 [Zasmidium cellare ATCC 36951]KAF2161190.1 hypothetical protein M409DRAFT_59441 [Zasmidium cellare ATCC 36951]